MCAMSSAEPQVGPAIATFHHVVEFSVTFGSKALYSDSQRWGNIWK
jgi:hypothetical protein